MTLELSSTLVRDFLHQGNGAHHLDMLDLTAAPLDIDFGVVEPNILAVANTKATVGQGDHLIYSDHANRMRL